MIADLIRRTREHFGVPDGAATEKTPLDYVCDLLSGGQTVAWLCNSMTDDLLMPIHRAQILDYLDTISSESDARQRIARARGAHALAESAIELVDAPAVDQLDVSRAASRAKVRQWTAERWNRPDMGGQAQATVTLNIGSLHLDALRAPRAPSAIAKPLPDAQVLPAPQTTVSLEVEATDVVVSG